MRDRGFEVVTKPTKVGPFDATFSVGLSATSYFIILESRGPDRNTQYAEGFEAVLYSLGDLDATLVGAYVVSRSSRHLSPAKRSLKPTALSYPFRLRDVSNMDILRRELAAQAVVLGRTGRAGGNNTKRLRLEFNLNHPLALRKIADLIAEDKAASAAPIRHVSFRPSSPNASGESGARRGVPATEVTRLHVEMQKRLYSQLVEGHGPNFVATELPMASGRPADLVVAASDGLSIYEIKTAVSPRECVRQALGQLLEYSFWPGSGLCKALWIVGPSVIDMRTKEYLQVLRDQFDLPLGYLSVSIENVESTAVKIVAEDAI